MAGETHRRDELRRAVGRDLARLERGKSPHGFWRSLALVGSVGWPIALLSAGGAVLGHLIDASRRGGIRYTLLLLFLGTAIGSAIAWRAVKGAA